jgi:hypothetical protein
MQAVRTVQRRQHAPDDIRSRIVIDFEWAGRSRPQRSHLPHRQRGNAQACDNTGDLPVHVLIFAS